MKLFFIISTSFLLSFIVGGVVSTAQIRDLIDFNGVDDELDKGGELELLTLPLEHSSAVSKVDIFSFQSNIWRGYVAHWKVQRVRRNKKKLHLKSVILEGSLKGYSESKNKELRGTDIRDMYFPDDAGLRGVPATWFTGFLRAVPKGAKMVSYRHMGFLQLYDREAFVKVVKGTVKDVCKYNATEEDLAEGADIADIINSRIKNCEGQLRG